jgi:hypothetical protein
MHIGGAAPALFVAEDCWFVTRLLRGMSREREDA